MSLSVIVDLCVIPMGEGVSVSPLVKQCVDIIKASGLKYHTHAFGTNLEGEWDEVFEVVRQCHQKLHDGGVARISSTLKVGTRIDKKATITDKIQAVQ